MVKDMVFPSKINLVKYFYMKLHNPTPIKIQCALYFTWAYYSASYGCMDIEQSENKGTGITYPKELFKARFVAGQYGPTDNAIWFYTSEDLIDPQAVDFTSLVTLQLPCVIYDIQLFIDSILKQIDQVNDFGLVSRTHQDNAWQTAYVADNKLMNNELIRNDYIKYFVIDKRL